MFAACICCDTHLYCCIFRALILLVLVINVSLFLAFRRFCIVISLSQPITIVYVVFLNENREANWETKISCIFLSVLFKIPTRLSFTAC